MKYSIIIPTYNHVDLLKACIESIIAYTDLEDCEIIVVANGCTDGTFDYIAPLYSEKKIDYLWFGEPLGYTVSVNHGIEYSHGEYIVLLNNDTILLPQPKNLWLEILVTPFLEDNDVAITGPMKEKTETIDREFILFFCAMIKAKLLNTDCIGLLDEIFSPGYGEDTDWCIRAENAGYKVVQVPEEKKQYYADKRQTGNFPIFHHGNETFKHHPDPDLIHRNNKIILTRYGTMEEKAIYLNSHPNEQVTHTTNNSIGVMGITGNDNAIKEGYGKKEEKPKSFLQHFLPKEEIEELKEHQNRMLNPKDDIPEGLFQSPTVKDEKIEYPPIKKDEYGFPIGTAFKGSTWITDYSKNPPTSRKLDIERAKTIDGFMGDEELMYLAKLASTAKVFIEIGSWHGKSSRAIADNLPEGGVLYCVDTWKGSENEQDTHHASAKDHNGDGAYIWFLDSCFDLIQKGKIIPLRMSSVNAEYFLKAHIIADVIFIDANHTYKAVKEDIITWQNRIDYHGIICGHDYGTSNPDLAGVTHAVNEIFPDVQIEPYTSIWVKDFSKKEPSYIPDIKITGKVLNCREPKIFDCFPFNNELDILEIRFNELYDVVDRFVIVEARETHAGKPKELIFHNNLTRFEKFLNKVTYLVIEQLPDYSHLEFNDSNWARERYQRDYIMNGLKDCQDDDIIIISDCDEIPNSKIISKQKNIEWLDDIASISMDLFYYNFNTIALDKWEESKIVRFKKLKELSPCGVRYHKGFIKVEGGWHLSYFGNTIDIINKIEATAHQEYNSPIYKAPMEINYKIHKGIDVFGRDNVKFEQVPISDNLPKWLLQSELLKKYSK